MIKRKLGQTGLEIGEIGLGCEGFVGKDEQHTRALVDAAHRLGINYVDLYTSDPDARVNFGRAIAGRRQDFVLQAHLCTIWKNGQYKRTRKIEEVRSGFEEMLGQLGTDYLEIGMIHYVDSMEDWREIVQGPVMAYAKELKAAGKIEHIGISSHNPVVALEAVKSGLIEVLMFSVNPCYDLLPASEDVEQLWADESYEKQLVNMDPQREALYETCQRAGVGNYGHEGIWRRRSAGRRFIARGRCADQFAVPALCADPSGRCDGAFGRAHGGAAGGGRGL